MPEMVHVVTTCVLKNLLKHRGYFKGKRYLLSMRQMLNEFRTSGCYNVDTSIPNPLRFYFCNTSSESFYISCCIDGLVPARLRPCMFAILFLFLSCVILVMLNENLLNVGKYLPNGTVWHLRKLEC